MKILVTGAAGFVGHHLCHYLKKKGHFVRAVDYKPPKYGCDADEVNWQCDLRWVLNAIDATSGMDWVFALAADMGGMGYIGFHHWRILFGNLLINLNTARAAVGSPKRLFYASSACVYPERLQESTCPRRLNEDDAWQGIPDTAYGIEKLVSEQIYLRMAENIIGMWDGVRIARFHNIYGPECTWRGGREKAPAAICRKVAEARRRFHSEIIIWGDGEQTRSFCHIRDCLEMLYRLMESDYTEPLNIGTDYSVSINEMVDMIAPELEKVHDLSQPQGVRGRNADLTRMQAVLGYTPQIPLDVGLRQLYEWIERQM